MWTYGGKNNSEIIKSKKTESTLINKMKEKLNGSAI